MDNWKRTLYIMFAVQLLSAVGFSSSFPFLSLYVESLDSWSGLSLDLRVGLVFSGQAFTMMLIAPLWGTLADRYGRKLMVMRASFGAAIIVGAMGFARSSEELILLRTIQGVFTGVMPATAALVASVAPRERAGYAMGLIQMAVWSGVAAGPLLGGLIADQFGFQATYLLTGTLLATGGLMVWLGVDERFVRAEPDPEKPRIMGQWRKLITMTGVIPTFSIRSFNWLARTMIVPYTPLLIASMLSDDAPIATVTGIIAGAAALSTTVSAFYLGRLSDRVGHRRVLVFATATAAVGYSIQFTVADVWQLGILQVLTGLAIGGVMPTLSALLNNYTPQGSEGSVYGLDTSVTSGMRTLGPLAGSVVFALFGLRALFLAGGILFVCATIVALRYMPPTELEKQKNLQLEPAA